MLDPMYVLQMIILFVIKFGILKKQNTIDNIKVIRINPDKNIKKESWEQVYYQGGLEFFKKLISNI